MLDVLKQKQSQLQNPFPYADIARIYDDFASEFEKLPEEKDSLSALKDGGGFAHC
ncbi:hypothetical protein [Bacillus alkalicellulosilyticus]|uniref:hypothetical protein n=1 Tax=Alkalihalobacterium alkalicellulosilyticum TaxID=1912214 RepID=UPI001482F92E|nr:hypothetical protein [Bacillus alkalicellulosilyticus]